MLSQEMAFKFIFLFLNLPAVWAGKLVCSFGFSVGTEQAANIPNSREGVLMFFFTRSLIPFPNSFVPFSWTLKEKNCLMVVIQFQRYPLLTLQLFRLCQNLSRRAKRFQFLQLNCYFSTSLDIPLLNMLSHLCLNG